jgi:ABC-type sugar transport system substrate-binding protein
MTGSKLGQVSSWLLLVVAAVSGGCDSESFVPARPTELGGSNAGSAVGPGVTAHTPSPSPSSSSASVSTHSGARAIEFIAGPRNLPDAEALKATARAQAGRDKTRILIAVTGETDSPGTEADLVRKAMARNPLALIVEPADPADSELAKAVNEARDRGLPVVVVGRPLAGSHPVPAQASGPGKAAGPADGPLVQVVPEPFARSARPLVEAAIRNARNAKLSPAGGAILVINTTGDRLFEDRALALRAALRNAGITTIEELRFAGTNEDVQAKLLALLRANRKPVMVLATDLLGVSAALQITGDLGEDRPFVIAGYSSDDSLANMVRAGEYAALAIYTPEKLISKAVTTAVAVARGEKLPDRVELMVLDLDSPGDSAAPNKFRMYKKMHESSESAEKKQEDQR